MILLDLNLLIFAHQSEAPDHEAARNWLNKALGDGEEEIAIAWVVVLGFLRITTNCKWLTVGEALEKMQRFLATPNIVMVSPGESHFSILASQLEKLGSGGNLTTDVHLAALAIEHGATVATHNEKDFKKFDYVDWFNPIAKEKPPKDAVG